MPGLDLNVDLTVGDLISAVTDLLDDDGRNIDDNPEYLRGQLELIGSVLPVLTGGDMAERVNLVREALIGQVAQLNAERVREEVQAEVTRNLESSDVHSPADIAADVVERLIKVHNLRGFNRDDSLEESDD